MVTPASPSFVSALEYFGKAMPLHDDDSAAEMWPFPRRSGASIEVVVLFYREAGPMGRRNVHPPDYEVVFSPDATVLRHGPRTAAELGITPAGVRAPEYAARWSVEAVEEAQRKLSALAPVVWAAFASGAQSSEIATSAGEYLRCHVVQSTEHDGPWSEQAGSEFFRWLRTAAAP